MLMLTLLDQLIIGRRKMKMKHLDKHIGNGVGAICLVLSGGAVYLYASEKLGNIVGVVFTAVVLLSIVRLVIKR